jgi:methyl-accepting chemotaxis protein
MFQNLKVGSKLAIAFALFFSFSLVIGIVSIWNLTASREAMDFLIKDRFEKVSRLAHIDNQVNLIARLARNMYIMREKNDVINEKNELLKARENIKNTIEELQPNIRSEEGKRLLADIISIRGKFVNSQEEYITAIIDKEDKELAYKILIEQLRPIQLEY